MNFEFLAVIPARKNSKRIKKKNLFLLNGKPLIWYSIQAAKKIKKISKIIVSSDDEQILSYSAKFGVDILKRPEKFAKSTSQQEEVIINAIEFYKKKDLNFKYIILLQPTSPLRKSKDIINCMKIIKKKGVNSVLSAYEKKMFLWQKKNKTYLPLNYNPKNRPRSQKLKSFMIENGAIYIFNTKIFLQKKNRIIKNLQIYTMPEEVSVDIDHLKDLKKAEAIIKND